MSVREWKLSDAGIRWFFLVAYAATCLTLWAFVPSALIRLGASVASQAPIGIDPATETNVYLLASLLVIAVPFALLEVGVLFWRHRRGFAEAAPQIALNRAAISKDLVKVAIILAITAALGVFGLYSVAHERGLAESFLSFLIALVLCYWLIASVFEMTKYLPIVRSLLRAD